MAKEKYIRERKNKDGKIVAYQVFIRHGQGKDRQTFVKTLKVSSYNGNKSATLKRAKEVRDQALIDFTKQRYLNESRYTVKDMYEKKFELFSNNIKTRMHHDSLYKQCIQPYEDMKITEVTSADVQRSLNSFARTHTHDMTSRAKTIWHQIFLTAQMNEIPVADKTIGIKVKSNVTREKRQTAISRKEFFSYLEALEKYNSGTEAGIKMSTDIKYMLLIMFYTGCRPAEALAINKTDIDFKRHELHIRRSIKSDDESTRIQGRTKTEESVRVIPMVDDLETVFKDLLKYSNKTPLLVARDGHPYEIGYVSDYIHRVSKKSRIKFNSYMLRHLFSTELFAKGISPIVIRDLMGHATANMSSDYANTSQKDMMDALKKRED